MFITVSFHFFKWNTIFWWKGKRGFQVCWPFSGPNTTRSSSSFFSSSSSFFHLHITHTCIWCHQSHPSPHTFPSSKPSSSEWVAFSVVLVPPNIETTSTRFKYVYDSSIPLTPFEQQPQDFLFRFLLFSVPDKNVIFSFNAITPFLVFLSSQTELSFFFFFREMIVAIASKSNIVSLWFMVAPQMLLTLYPNSSKQFPSTTFNFISYILFL